MSAVAAAVEKTPLELARERLDYFYATHEDELNPSRKDHKALIAQREARERAAANAAEKERVKAVRAAEKEEQKKEVRCVTCKTLLRNATTEQRNGGQWENAKKMLPPWTCGRCVYAEERSNEW